MSKIIAKTLAAFLIITAALAFIGYKIYRNSQSITQINNEIIRSYTIISANKDVSSQAKDMVLATRGYLLTEDSMYLRPYTLAASGYPVSMATLKKAAVNRSETLQEHVNRLASLMETRHSYSESYIITRHTKGLSAAVQLFKERTNGNLIMDSIRSEIQQIEKLEFTFLKNILNNREHQVKEMSELQLGLIGVIVIALALVLVLLSRDITGRLKAEKNLKDLNATLEQQIEERTEELKRSFEDMEAKVKFRNLELEKQNLELRKKLGM